MFCPRCFRRYQEGGFCPHDGERLVEKPDMARLQRRCIEKAKGFAGDDYLLRGLIGAGDIAEVYLAEHRLTGEPVAVKVLRARRLRDASIKARFILEANATLRVDHPNVVKVLDVGVRSNGAPFIVMEYLFGESLHDALANKVRLRPDVAIPLMIQMAEAIAAAHDVGIIHRDIKPGNIFLVGEPGSPHTVKVVDFGMAKLSEHARLTQAGVAVGTLEYMAPEQAVGDPPDPRTDVYGFGVTMYRVLSGRLPFQDKEEPRLLAKHLFVAPPPLDPGPLRIPPRLGAVVMKAIRKSPEHRYPSMRALVQDLERAMDPAAPLLALEPMPEDRYVPIIPSAERALAFLRRKLET